MTPDEDKSASLACVNEHEHRPRCLKSSFWRGCLSPLHLPARGSSSRSGIESRVDFDKGPD